MLTFNEPCLEERTQEKCEFPEFLLSKKSRLHHGPPDRPPMPQVTRLGMPHHSTIPLELFTAARTTTSTS